MKKYWVRSLGVIGAIITMQSVLWEYARMHPQYGFLVDPWSIRGYEIVHGAIALSIGALALVAFLAVAWNGSQKPATGALITLGMVLGGTAITAIFGGGSFEVTPSLFLVMVLSLVVGTIAYRLITAAIEGSELGSKFWFRSLLYIALLAVTGMILAAAIGGRDLSMPQWVAIGIILILLAALSLSPEPRELGANRMLMYSSIAGAAALALSAGAVRSTLVRLQAEAGGVPSQYRDTQVTSGHLMAVFGMVLVFFAAVALWARRRDAILTASRAAKQRAAAEESAREIQEALETAGLAR